MKIKKTINMLIAFGLLLVFVQLSSAVERQDELSDIDKYPRENVSPIASKQQYFFDLSYFSEPLKKRCHHTIRSISVIMPDGTEYESEWWERGKTLHFRAYGVADFGIQVAITKQMFPLILKVLPMSDKVYKESANLPATPIYKWAPWGDNALYFNINKSDVFDEVGTQIITHILVYTPTVEWQSTILKLIDSK